MGLRTTLTGGDGTDDASTAERGDGPPSSEPGAEVQGHDESGSEGRGDDEPSELVGEELVLGYPTADEPVVDGATLAAEPGEVTALVGPNGSGKSTLLKGLADQLAPAYGSVLLDGREVHEMGTRELARQLGMLSQERSVPDSITVEDLVFHGRYPHRGFFEHVTESDQAAVDRAIDLAGCGHLRDREVGSLSGGQKQLAWIAMALAQETDVLLLDEPTTFLDMHHQLEVLEIVETLREDSDVTVVVVLHDVEQAARLADRVVALQDGEIRARGAPEDVLTEDLLREVFRIESEVTATDDGLRVTPLRPCHDDEGDETTAANEASVGADDTAADGSDDAASERVEPPTADD